MQPHVFRGLWCRCGAQHHQEAGYYVSVEDGGRHILALGPYQEHGQALALVDTVRREVLEKWDAGGKAHWYGYGTAVVKHGPFRPGKLNATLGSAQL